MIHRCPGREGVPGTKPVRVVGQTAPRVQTPRVHRRRPPRPADMGGRTKPAARARARISRVASTHRSTRQDRDRGAAGVPRADHLGSPVRVHQGCQGTHRRRVRRGRQRHPHGHRRQRTHESPAEERDNRAFRLRQIVKGESLFLQVFPYGQIE